MAHLAAGHYKSGLPLFGDFLKLPVISDIALLVEKRTLIARPATVAPRDGDQPKVLVRVEVITEIFETTIDGDQ